MSSLFAKRILSSGLFSSGTSQNHYLALLTPLLHTISLSTQTQQQKEVPFVAQYLISTLGFSPDRALAVSSFGKNRRISSLTRPKSVVQFLKETGLSEDKIKAVISFNPLLLSYNVDETLKPKLQQLKEVGVTGEVLVDLIRYNPFVFEAKDTVAKIQFWRQFVGDTLFPKLIRRNGLLVTRGIGRYVTPRIDLLKDYGLSNKDITVLLTKGSSRFMILSLDRISKKLKETEELGFSRKSNMFIYGLLIAISNKKETLNKKSHFLQKMYGWSEEDVQFAFMKFPNMMSISESKVKAAMDFLINRAGFEPRNIAVQPLLLGYSLEKRLIPRYHVMSMIKTHGLKELNLLSLCVMSEKTFFKKCIQRHEKNVPGLAEAYAAACSGKVSH